MTPLSLPAGGGPGLSLPNEYAPLPLLPGLVFSDVNEPFFLTGDDPAEPGGAAENDLLRPA